MFDFQQLIQALLQQLLMQSMQQFQAGGLGAPMLQTPPSSPQGPAPLGVIGTPESGGMSKGSPSLGGFPFDFGRVGGNPNPFAPPTPAPPPMPTAQTFTPGGGQMALAQALLRSGQLQLPRGSYSAPAGGPVSFTPVGSGLGQGSSTPTKPPISLGGLTPVTQRPTTTGPGSFDPLA